MSERVEGSDQNINNHQSPHGPENTNKADLDEDISQQSMPQVPNGLESYEAQNRWKYRFEVTILVLATLTLATCLLQAMADSSYSILRLVAFPCALFLAFYGYQWVVYFSDGLTQRKQAYFDVRNMLETYQPNRNTEKARLFQPDPPTPNVKAIAAISLTRNGQDNNHGNNENNAAAQEHNHGNNENNAAAQEHKKNFLNWRNQYYANEYTIALQAKKDRMPLYAPTPNEQADGVNNPAPETPSITTNKEEAPEQREQDQNEEEQPTQTETTTNKKKNNGEAGAN